MRYRLTIAAVVTVTTLALTACSGDDTAASRAPAATTTTAAPAPVEAVTSTPTPTPISKEEAGAQYLALVEPVNALVPAWNDAATSANWAAIRTQAQPYADANRAFADGLMAAEWPAEAQPVVDSLIAELAADISAFVQIAGTTTDEETFAVVNSFPARGSSAQQLRIILGLDNVPAG